MKKILVVICIMLLFTSVASAKISKTVDKFDGKIKISSKTGGSMTTRIFSKDIPKNSDQENVSLIILKAKPEWWFFADDAFEFKIDDIIYKTNKAVTYSTMRSDILGNNLVTGAYVDIDEELIEKILEAKAITLRYYFSNQPSEIWDVPEEILNEWKKVIRATKDTDLKNK